MRATILGRTCILLYFPHFLKLPASLPFLFRGEIRFLFQKVYFFSIYSFLLQLSFFIISSFSNFMILSFNSFLPFNLHASFNRLFNSVFVVLSCRGFLVLHIFSCFLSPTLAIHTVTAGYIFSLLGLNHPLS